MQVSFIRFEFHSPSDVAASRENSSVFANVNNSWFIDTNEGYNSSRCEQNPVRRNNMTSDNIRPIRNKSRASSKSKTKADVLPCLPVTPTRRSPINPVKQYQCSEDHAIRQGSAISGDKKKISGGKCASCCQSRTLMKIIVFIAILSLLLNFTLLSVLMDYFCDLDLSARVLCSNNFYYFIGRIASLIC